MIFINIYLIGLFVCFVVSGYLYSDDSELAFLGFLSLIWPISLIGLLCIGIAMIPIKIGKLIKNKLTEV